MDEFYHQLTIDLLEKASQLVSKNDAKGVAERAKALVAQHEAWRAGKSINLIASENILSPSAAAMLSTDLAGRVAEGHPGTKLYKGTDYVSELEALVIEAAKKVFDAKYVEFRPLSGTMANAVGFYSLTAPGDTIMTLSLSAGAHISYRPYGVAGMRGLKVVDIPFDIEDYEIDLEAFEGLARSIKPRLVVVGATIILFPYPLKRIREVADKVGSMVMYDGAHVMGLIAGGRFQAPLREGAHILAGSTHKTFPGPVGGMILSNDQEVAKEVDQAAFPGLTATHTLNRVASTAVVLAELMEFGGEYAAQIVKNAKSLAESLAQEGFTILYPHKGFTESHMIVADVTGQGGGERASTLLEKANIITNKNILPKESEQSVKDPGGLRLATSEVTRLGMKEDEMKTIANLIRTVLIGGEDPEVVAQEVSEFRASYQKIYYCFD